MLLKNHLIEVFKQASLENNFLLKDNVVLKWVHRFGIDSLNDLLIHSSLQKENQPEENQPEENQKQNQEQISLTYEDPKEENQKQNQEQISLTYEDPKEENQKQNQEQISLKSVKTLENLEEIKCESNYLEISKNNEVFNTKQDSKQTNNYVKTSKLPLPYIKSLRKWINKDKKAS